MKLSKFVPVALASVVLAACSSQPKPQEVLAQANQAGVDKVVAYACANEQNLKVTYSFVNGEVKTAKILVNDNLIPDTLLKDPKSKDSSRFVALAGGYSLDVGGQLSLDNYTAVNVAKLSKLGKKTDSVLAKDCTVDSELTAKLN